MIGTDYADPYGDEVHENRGASWAPLDLGPYLRGEVKAQEPDVGLARNDGLHMLYRGKEHGVFGEMEAGKSWFSVACAAAELTRGERVVYVHFEEQDPSDTIGRLQALGVPDDTIVSGFAFVGPAEPVDKWAYAVLLDPAPSLVVLDGMNEALGLHDLDSHKDSSIVAFRRMLAKPAKAAGAAVLVCDHPVKDREARGRGPGGSGHKANGVDGSMITLENAEPFGRGQRGASHVYVTKDRPAQLRQHGRAIAKVPGKTYLGTLVVDDTREFRPYLDLTVLAPRDDGPEPTGETRDDQDDEAVLSIVANITATGGAASRRQVRSVTGVSKERTSDALTRLVMDGRLVETAGPNRSRQYTIPEGTPGGPVVRS